MRRALFLTLAIGLLGAIGSPTRYEVTADSRFWIDGSATTGDWTCEADALSGYGVVGEQSALQAEVSIPVRDFDCGFGPMNRDLRRALDAENHPAIQFTLDHAETLGDETEAGTWVPVRTSGTLRLAGAERAITLTAEGRRQPDGTVAIRGQHDLRMSDFGVKPPSHALGLVRAHDDIVARFDLIATAR